MNQGLAEMFCYNAWANRTLYEACRSLSDEQLDSEVPGISGSIRELLMHIAGGQQTLVLGDVRHRAKQRATAHGASTVFKH